MSDLSLLTGVYTNVEHFASLVDAVIQRIAAPGENQPCGEQRELGQLLVDVGGQDRRAKSYEALVLESLLKKPAGEPHLNIGSLGKRLLADNVDATDHMQLELLAKVLEQERSEVVSRLRGRR